MSNKIGITQIERLDKFFLIGPLIVSPVRVAVFAAITIIAIAAGIIAAFTGFCTQYAGCFVSRALFVVSGYAVMNLLCSLANFASFGIASCCGLDNVKSTEQASNLYEIFPKLMGKPKEMNI